MEPEAITPSNTSNDIDTAHWGGEHDALSDEEERRVLFAAVNAFKQYRKNAHHNVTHRRRQNFYALPSAHWQALDGAFAYLETLNRVDHAIDSNAEIASGIFEYGLKAFGLPSEPVKASAGDWQHTLSSNDVAKAHSTIRQFYRDWSQEGFEERRKVYESVFQDLQHFLPSDPGRTRSRVLVPGAGLGRLVFELCLAGFDAEGNEISYHQLLASNWILNYVQPNQKFTLFPFVTQFTNIVSREDQFRGVSIPDIHPGRTLAEAAQRGQDVGEMNMTAADFVVWYSSPSQAELFTAVTTVFFIDTAPNLIRYVEAIRNCLVSGGVWINVGPLLWHFDDRAPTDLADRDDKRGPGKFEGIGEPGAFELSDDEVILLVERMGFKLEKHEILPEPTGYMQDPKSMLQSLYNVSHWVARKL